MSKIITSPLSRFENLPGYNFSPNYLEIQPGLNMHYVDEGAKENPIVLLLHGEPSWSYLYRKMIPILVQNNFRAIAPDFIGFGKSDKFVDQDQYSYQKHIDWMKTFLKALDLKDMMLFCQDWGGLIGLRLVAEIPDLFTHIVASNTTLPTGKIVLPEAFMQWREYSRTSSSFNIGKVINSGTVETLSEDVIAAYNAPFPSEEYKAGARIFPSLVPVLEDDREAINNKKAWKALMNWKKPFLTIFGEQDPIMKGAEKFFHKVVPGAQGQNHSYLNAGHFIQEEKGAELAKQMVVFYNNNKTGS